MEIRLVVASGSGVGGVGREVGLLSLLRWRCSVSWLYPCQYTGCNIAYSFARYYHQRRPGHKRSLSIISYNCL